MDISTSISNSISKGSVNEEFSISQAALEDARNQKPESISNEEIRQGDMILETYTVTSNAIHGGMGSVWQVHHQNWNTDLAMKRPQPRFFSEGSEERKEEFIAECENWINLGLHPNIVSCYYVREIGGVPTIFSEWMENGSLKDRIRDGALYEGTAQEVQKRILDIAIRSAYGLAYSHENGLIHQDVKPGNLLLTKDWEAKVADFGLAKAQSRLTDGATIAYCPKEQAEGAPAEKWMDVYAWALTVLEMYAGKRLWKTGDEVHWKRSEIYSQCRIAFTPRMEELIDCCLAKEIDDFLRVEEYLNEEYLDLNGKAYPQSASKAAPDTTDSLNNRAISFLDLGKADVAEHFWNIALKKDYTNSTSTCNSCMHLWNTGKATDETVVETISREYIRTEREDLKTVLYAFLNHTNRVNPTYDLLFQAEELLREEKKSGDFLPYVDEHITVPNCKILSACFISQISILTGGKGFFCLVPWSGSQKGNIRYFSQVELGGYSGLSPSICTFYRICRDKEKRQIRCYGNSAFSGYFILTLDGESLNAISFEPSDYATVIDQKILNPTEYDIKRVNNKIHFISRESERCLRTVQGETCTDVMEEKHLALIVEGYGAARILELPEDKPLRHFLLAKAVSTADTLRNEKKADQLTQDIIRETENGNYSKAANHLNRLREIPGFEAAESILEQEAVIQKHCFAERLSYVDLRLRPEVKMADRFCWTEISGGERQVVKQITRCLIGKTREVRYTEWGDRAEHKCVSGEPVVCNRDLKIYAVRAVYRKIGGYGAEQIEAIEILHCTDSGIQLIAAFDQRITEWRNRITFSMDGRKKAVEYDARQNELYLEETGGGSMYLTSLDHKKIGDIVFSPDGRFLAIAIAAENDAGTSLVILNTEEPQNAFKVSIKSPVKPGTLTFSDDGRYLFCSTGECVHIGYFYDGGRPAAKKLSAENEDRTKKKAGLLGRLLRL